MCHARVCEMRAFTTAGLEARVRTPFASWERPKAPLCPFTNKGCAWPRDMQIIKISR